MDTGCAPPEWTHRAGKPDRLLLRANAERLPCRGLLREEDDYREYRVSPAREALQRALIDFLVAELHGERPPRVRAGESSEVKLDGRTVNVSFSEESSHVGVWIERGPDTQLVATIAKRFDAALATRKYDALVVR